MLEMGDQLKRSGKRELLLCGLLVCSRSIGEDDGASAIASTVSCGHLVRCKSMRQSSTHGSLTDIHSAFPTPIMRVSIGVSSAGRRNFAAAIHMTRLLESHAASPE